MQKHWAQTFVDNVTKIKPNAGTLSLSISGSNTT